MKYPFRSFLLIVSLLFLRTDYSLAQLLRMPEPSRAMTGVIFSRNLTAIPNHIGHPYNYSGNCPNSVSISSSLPCEQPFSTTDNCLSRNPRRKLNAVNVQNYLLDTVVAVSNSGTERYSYSYNATGRIISCLDEEWQYGQWVNSSLYTYTLDPSGNVLEQLIKFWQNGQWTDSERVTHTYDSTGRIVGTLIDSWQYGQLTYSDSWTYSYDSNGNLLTTFENFVLVPGDSSRYTYTYDSNGNELTRAINFWQNGQLAFSWRYTYAYDGNGNMISGTMGYRSNGQLTDSVTIADTYDAKGDLLHELDKVWQDGQWMNSAQGTYTYDGSGHQLTQLIERWQTDGWVNSDLYTTTQDINGHELTWLHQVWKNVQWADSERTTNTYDQYGNIVQYLHQTWQLSSWVPSDGGVSVSVHGNSYVWTGYSGYRVTFTWVDTLGKPSVPAAFSLFQNYPNPFNPTTTIRYDLPSQSFVTITVFDVIGRKIETLVNEEKAPGSYQVTFDASTLASGVYFYRLTAANLVSVKKFIIIK